MWEMETGKGNMTVIHNIIIRWSVWGGNFIYFMLLSFKIFHQYLTYKFIVIGAGTDEKCVLSVWKFIDLIHYAYYTFKCNKSVFPYVIQEGGSGLDWMVLYKSLFTFMCLCSCSKVHIIIVRSLLFIHIISCHFFFENLEEVHDFFNIE